MTEAEIYQRLKELVKNSKTTYYHYAVASILVLKNGQTFEGVNIETASPASGICAERNALFAALTKGIVKEDMKELYLYNDHGDICFPCFICRQALFEYCPKDLKIITFDKQAQKKIVTLFDLCPYPFEAGDVQ